MLKILFLKILNFIFYQLEKIILWNFGIFEMELIMDYFNIMIKKWIVSNFIKINKKLLLLEWILKFGKIQFKNNQNKTIKKLNKIVVQKFVQIHKFLLIIFNQK